MKTKLLLSALLSFYFYLLSSQVPLGFNYQAIARDGSGNILANQALPVKIDIQTSLTGGSLIYEELFASVTSNQFGLISLVVGTGIWQAGSAPSFSAIDWKAQTLYLKTQIQYPGPGWTTMGTSQIWGVPYSLVAKDVQGPIAKLGINGTTDDMEEALFEVKNKAGSTVFAVYNEGVRAYVGNGDTKGKKGGFAVGGYDATKGTTYDLFVLNTDSARFYIDSKPNLKGKKGGFSVGGYDMTKGSIPVQNYLDVSKDSVRIYIDSNPLTKGKKGGFAVGGYDMTKGTNDNYLNVNTDATGIVNPVNRILWYPLKNAFLTGKVRIGTPDSVGENSFASGYESKARGVYSQALGYKAIANGDYSTAIGKNAVADFTNSYAFGNGTKAIKDGSYAFGIGAIASGNQSFAFGSVGIDTFRVVTGINTQALGDNSFAIGMGALSSKTGAFAIGTGANATGNFALSMGYGTISSGAYSTALGFVSTASANFSEAIGISNHSTGQESISVGGSNESSGDYSQAIGIQNYSIGYISSAIGSWNSAEGERSIAYGNNNEVKGQYSIGVGVHNISSVDDALTLGDYNTASGSGSTAIGHISRAGAFASLAIGFNNYSSGYASTSIGYSTIASGNESTSMGIFTKANSYASFAIGRYNDTTCSASGNTSWVATDPLFIIGCGENQWDRRNALTILKNGNTAIGLATPTQKLDVDGNARFRSVGSDTYFAPLNITSDGTLTTSTSDISMKKNIIPINQALQKVLEMNGVYFSWKNDDYNNRRVGFIAQEMEKILPEVVYTNPVDGLKGINYPEITAVLAQAVKEQEQKIDSQQKEIDELKALVNKLVANQTAQVNK